jgi:hypothetical protein
MAFDFTEDSTGDSTALAIQLDGHLITLLNKVKGLSLSACFEGSADPMKANQWNREHFSTRVFLNEKGCTSLGADVSFGGGSTNQMIQDFVRGFSTDVVVFAKFLASPPAGPDTSSVSLPPVFRRRSGSRRRSVRWRGHNRALMRSVHSHCREVPGPIRGF